MQPEGGVTLIIALGGGNPPPNDNSLKKGCEMIVVPIETLVTDTEGGEALTPEVGDTVVLEVVEGTVSHINEDGTAHIELKTAGGEPIGYAENESEAADDAQALGGEIVAEDLDKIEAELLAAAEEEDEKMES